MDGQTLIVGFLIALNVYQLWYWSRINQALVDRLMSRNYADYIASTSYAKNLPASTDAPTSQVSDDDILRELNGVLGG